MKRLPAILLLLLVGCSAERQPLAFSYPPANPTSPTIASTPLRPGEVQAFIVQGDIKLRTADGQLVPLVRKAKFQEGSTIVSGKDGMGLLVFSNGSTLKFTPNTEMTVKLFRQAPFDEKALGTFLRLTQDPSKSTTVLVLSKGTLQGEVRHLNEDAGSTFVIETPQGVKNVRDFISVGIAADGVTTTRAFAPSGQM